MKYAWIRTHQQEDSWPVESMCLVLKVSALRLAAWR